MNALENVKPEEITEDVATTERTEEQVVEETAVEPGARVEETQTYEQAEAVESALVEAVNTAEAQSVDRQATETVSADEIDTPAEGSTGGEEATPINVPGPVTAEVATSAPSSGAEGVSATPINLPNTVDDSATSGSVGRPGGEVSATPINLPNPVDENVDGGSVGRPGGDVSATPINLPNPVEDSVEIGSAGRPGGKVSATPINLPNTIDDSATSGSVGRPGGEVSATPINLPYPVENQVEAMGADTLAECPEPGDPPPPPDRIAEAPEPGPDPFPRVADDGSELMREIGEIPQPGMAAAEVLVSPEIEGEFFAGEMLDGAVVVMPMMENIAEHVGESEEAGEGNAERPGKIPEWYLHEDENGNITVVDENGKPVDSPPNIIYFNGKYYAVYPGDDFPVKEDGSVTDSGKLAEFEIESYKSSAKGLYLHEDKDGNVTVVDENGKPVDSPPNVIYYQG